MSYTGLFSLTILNTDTVSQTFWVTTFLIFAYLYPETQGVEHDKEEHEVLEVAGGDDVPDSVLVGVFRDVAPQRTGLQGVLYTLTLWGSINKIE